ncbi:ABC transporter ATP-binding protein [Halobacillus halophilus]|uniref:ABC-type transport system ATP-binding protein (Probable substrate branched-chain amino acid) n=1 Tax=Halobacillus halophilus (strain ATCC 35676 / DSM 2266 / JCM 20832 / KCTC 3685 / LMG 17431 / NBRC 102448 / NCIMB 2269) TaxID=866895 RepID=I0JIE0_HALH3|nr:ABC transporter ATP-binding protein [Halobacillus halophilus]ASF38093.1 ABC transporter ATP-binding protein [Halobacillus halophilus]CCG43908.1 ABC-type transport system ATP-binding protein (probable substrate branched-chain amino acid) [Halobacillus halophilus DSM 2266]
MLELSNVSVKYGSFAAVKDIDIQVGEGELVVLLGSNGAGKSTTFNAISGLQKPSAGDIIFEGKSITGLSPDKIVQAGIVQCAEDRKLFPQMSVHQNLIMGAYVHRKKRKQVKESISEVYELFPILREKKENAAGSLSGGQQQMLAIGRALMSRPKMMLLDEPSIGLAPLIVEQMFEVIQKINKDGTTVLLAEQNAFAALKIADRGYVFESGSMVVQGSSEELLANDTVRRAYIGA